MSLPHEVLALLGDDATPEEAAHRMQVLSRENAAGASAYATVKGGFAVIYAKDAFATALAAAAIHECEAVRNHADAKHACDLALLDAAPEEMSALAAERDAAAKEEREATAQYDALRHWRNRR